MQISQPLEGYAKGGSTRQNANLELVAIYATFHILTMLQSTLLEWYHNCIMIYSNVQTSHCVAWQETLKIKH